MTDDFNKRLESAIERGKRDADDRVKSQKKRQETAEELQERHSEYRLALCDHIEKTINQLADHFPGFRAEESSYN